MSYHSGTKRIGKHTSTRGAFKPANKGKKKRRQYNYLPKKK